MMSFIQRFFKGMSYPFQGFQVYRSHRSLKIISLAPMVLAILTVIFGGSLGFQWVGKLMEILSEQLAVNMEGFILWLVSAFFFLLYIVMLLLCLMILVNLLAIPFNALIAEVALKKIGTDFYVPKTKGEWVKFSMQMLLAGLFKAGLFLSIGLFLFVFSFLPILSLVAAYFAVVLLAYDCCDYALELKAYRFRDRMRFLKTKFPEISGFALVLAVTFVLPGLNFLLLPIFVVGGCCLVAKEAEPISLPEAPLFAPINNEGHKDS